MSNRNTKDKLLTSAPILANPMLAVRAVNN
jgi:hypothetical protein